MLIEVKNGQEIETLLNNKEDFLIKFEASWCHPCKVIDPYIQEIAHSQGIKVLKTDIEIENVYYLVKKFNVKAVPTLILIKEGKEKKSLVGLVNKKQILSLLKE